MLSETEILSIHQKLVAVSLAKVCARKNCINDCVCDSTVNEMDFLNNMQALSLPVYKNPDLSTFHYSFIGSRSAPPPATTPDRDSSKEGRLDLGEVSEGREYAPFKQTDAVHATSTTEGHL